MTIVQPVHARATPQADKPLDAAPQRPTWTRTAPDKPARDGMVSSGALGARSDAPGAAQAPQHARGASIRPANQYLPQATAYNHPFPAAGQMHALMPAFRPFLAFVPGGLPAQVHAVGLFPGGMPPQVQQQPHVQPQPHQPQDP